MASPDWIVANLATERKAALNRIKEITTEALTPRLMVVDPFTRVDELEDALHRIERIAKSV